MKAVSNEQIEAFVEGCRRVGKYGLVRCSSGNMSQRISDELVLMSASGAWLGEIKSEQVSICRLEDGSSIEGPKPTVESRFHLGILRARADVNIVLHFQSPFATAVACGDASGYNFSVIIEVPYYIGEPAIVEYLPPGSAELAEAVVSAAAGHDMVIMRNHGLVTVGRDFDDAIAKACFFELACQVLICQDKLKPLSKNAIESLKKVCRKA